MKKTIIMFLVVLVVVVAIFSAWRLLNYSSSQPIRQTQEIR